MQNPINRRGFILKAGAAAGALAFPEIIPSRAFGANDRIMMGIIGPGGRGRSVMTEFQQQGAEFAAVCDAYEGNLAEGVKVASKKGGTPRTYARWMEMLEKERGKLDAILIATPEHQHGVQLINTVKAGFDSYCEKPMSHSIQEGNRIVREVRKTDRIVQIGMQRRSTPFVRAGKEVIDTGILGKVTLVRVKWNWNHLPPINNDPLPGKFDKSDWKAFCYPSRVIPYEPKKFRQWRYFWNFSGGNITDQGTHLMDVVQWYMGEEMKPVTAKYAECFGGVYKFEGIETPDVFTSIYQYDGFIVNWSLNYANSYQNSWSIEFMGTKGTMVLDDAGMRIYDDPWQGSPDSTLESRKAPVQQMKGGLESISHVKNFLECMASRKEPNAPVEIGHLAVSGPHLANVAYHARERAYLSRGAKHVTTNDLRLKLGWR